MHCAISIHALREEGDQSCTLNLPCHENFYPRPPRGGRHIPAPVCACCGKFLSTPSARRATNNTNKSTRPLEISIHALREEGDYSYAISHTGADKISIHALREEGDDERSR